jgi:cellulose synthase operon protein C
MRRRIFLTIIITLVVASVSASTFVAVQRSAAQKRRAPARKPSTQAKGKQPAHVPATTPGSAPRKADPNRAPQSAVDAALYTNEEFFGANASVARPYADALGRVEALAARHPKDARLHLHAARLAERLSQFDKAASEMIAYADLKGRSPDALRRLANFYSNRALYADQVKTLRELAAALPVSERGGVYKRAANVVRSRSLKEFKPADFFAELTAADPSNIQPVKEYVEELRLSKQGREALSVLESFQPKFPDHLVYFLKTRSRILEDGGDRRGAEQVYTATFDPNWPHAIAADYYDLLRRFGRYRIVRRGLQEQVRGGAKDLNTVGRLFSIYAYEGNYEQAARVLAQFEARGPQIGNVRTPAAEQSVDTNSAGPLLEAANLTPTEAEPAQAGLRSTLETVAGMYSSIGHYDQASRYLYTLYLTGGLEAATPERENALYRIFKVMLDAAGTQTRVAGGDLSFYRDIAEVDRHPGFMNGVLSLILTGTDPAQEFATEEKSAAGYFNRAFAYRIFTAFKQEYPQSPHLGEMFLGVVNIFSGLGEHKLAVEAGREFQQRFPNSPAYVDVSLRIADSLVSLKDRAGERAELLKLLDKLAAANPRGNLLVPMAAKRWSYGITPGAEHLVDRIRYNIEAYSDTYDPTQEGDDSEGEESEDDSEFEYSGSSVDSSKPGTSYSSVLERYVGSLALEDKKTETLAFFWSEIKKHPREEGLYERFLRWLGQAQLVNDQLRAYNSAVREFDSNTWHHRLARWYVRQKRGRELTRYSKQLIDVFDEEEITEYLLRFAGYGGTPEGDSLNWDQRLAFDLYSYAHAHFPRNLFFVRGMLTYLEKNDRAQWQKLSTEYYFADRSIREPYLAWLSKENQLRDRYRQAEAKNAAMPASTAGSPIAYRVFAADTAAWLSHHDAALDAYRQLVSLYPGEKQYVDRLSDIARSLGQTSTKLYEEAAGVSARMADIYPSDHTHRIKAGEIYAELGDFNRAAEQWNRLVQLEPGDRETYLEVATVFWDYYQFDQAIRVLKELRNVTGDSSIYAYRLGAVYEGKGDIDSAIAEYVKVLPEAGQGRDTVAERLAQLSKRKGLADKITAAYQSARASHPSDWELVLGYATYEAERDRPAEALAMLRTEVSRSSEVAFLESVRDLFRAILRPEDEQMVIERLAAVARDERESMMYRLQLASFLERQRKTDAALSVIDKLTGDYPTNVGVVEEAAQFYWRGGMRDRSIELLKRTLARSQGSYKRTLTLQLARRQIDAAKLADAEATLRAFYAENRRDSEVFAELARTLGAANKLPELAALYQEAFKEARESGLSSEETRAQVVGLREGMVRTLASLGKNEEALDQHIEIINASPEDADRLATAIDFAVKHNLSTRLTGYYERLTKESFKNYRWQLVLGRIYEKQGNLAGASAQYRGAVVNEPQRTDLRLDLAAILTRERRYDEAITTLRDGWRLTGRDPQWLIEVARIQVRQGLRNDAIATMREALAAKQNAKLEPQLNVAAQLASWGLYSETVRIYEDVFTKLPKTLKDEYVSGDHVTGYVRALIRVEPAASVFQKLERMRSQYQAIAQNSQDTDGYKARSIVSALEQAMRSDFGRGVLDYATAAEAAALAESVRAATQNLTTLGDAPQLRRYLGLARAAGLVGAEEQLYVQLKDAAFKARTRPEDQNYYNELRALVGFYNRHAAFARAAEVLSAEMRRDPHKGRFDFMNQIAIQYRMAGDQTREIEALRAAYAGASGELIAGNIDWVERYLSLLYDSGKRVELQRLASAYSPHQLQLINFLVEKNDKDLALNAIERARQQPAWVASRSAEVGLFLKDISVETEEYFARALDRKPIGQMVGRRVDRNRNLVGDDWFVGARNYGYWLGLVGRENDSRKLVVAEIEGHPTTARAQLELAAYYLERKTLPRAAEHVALAAELAPNDTDTIVMRGSVALAQGDRKAAAEAWATLIQNQPGISNAAAYLKVMANNGFLKEALPVLETSLVAYVNQVAKEDENNDHIDAVKPLVREIADRARSDARLSEEAAGFFQRVITRTPEDMVIGRLLIEEGLLPETNLTSIYRLVHQRLSNKAQAVFGTEEYEQGYWSGTEFFYPGRALAEWRRRLLDYLIRTRAFAEARLLIATIRQEQADLKLASQEDTVEDRYEWLPLAAALVELRDGREPARGIAELRRYCGLESTPTANESSETGIAHERCLKAYALLVAERRDAEAETLLYDSYRAAIASRRTDDAAIAGLAEMEARRGRGDEAGRLLTTLVERSVDNTRSLQLAAETAARVGRYAQAVEFREQLATTNPTDATNRLELARALAASGKAGEALDRIVALIGERATPNSVRVQSAEVIGDLVRADRAIARQSVIDQLAAQSSEGATLARAAILEASGRTEEARALMTGISSGAVGAAAQMKLGLLALAQGRDTEAASHFERALNLDADGSTTDAIAFRAVGPRAQLITIYSRVGRDLAALRLAEGDGAGQRTLISQAVRTALASGSGRTEQAAAAAFEPPLEPSSKPAAMKTLAEMNQASASSSQQGLLSALAESAARLGQYDRAIAMQRVRAVEATKIEERALIEKRLAEIIAADRARQLRLLTLLRMTRSNTTGSIYADRLLGGS